MEKYEDALHLFYSNKQKYEKKIESSKLKILRKDNLSIREKREQIQNMKIKCIYCKRNVGTRFIVTPDEYRVVCGNTETPCNLNLHIRKLKQIDGLKALEELYKEIKNIIIQIISLKHILLYDLIQDDKDDVLSKFKTIRDEYNELLKKKNNHSFKINQQTMSEERENQVKEMTSHNYQLLQQFKTQLQEGLLSRSYAIIKDAILFYTEELKPSFREIEEHRYASRTIEDDIYNNNIKRLYRNINDLSMYQITTQQYEIISLKI